MVNGVVESDKKQHLLVPDHVSWPQRAMEKKVLMGHMGTEALAEEMHRRLLVLPGFAELQTALGKKGVQAVRKGTSASAVV